MFWNCTGSANINDLRDSVKRDDIICLCETWCIVEPVITLFTPNEHCYKTLHSPAERSADRGRAKGGIAIHLNTKTYTPVTLFSTKNFVITRYVREILNSYRIQYT